MLTKILTLLMTDEEKAKLALQLIKEQKELEEEVKNFYAPLLNVLKRKTLSYLPKIFSKLDPKAQLKKDVKRQILFMLTNPSFFPYVKDLTVLNLSNMDLKSIPPEIQKLEKLQSLYLTKNELKELPLFIKQLKNLRSFILNDNQLETITVDLFAQLPNLKVLDLRRNPISEAKEKEIKSALKHIKIIQFYRKEIT